MPNSLPVPSKGALRTLRKLALGTSCTVFFGAGVLVEDRRRRIHFATKVLENAKKLKSSKQYHGGTGTAASEASEDHTLLHRHDAYWLPSNVLKSTADGAIDSKPPVDSSCHESLSAKDPVPAPLNTSRYSKTEQKQTSRFEIYQATPASKPSQARATFKENSQQRQHQLALDMTKLLKNNESGAGLAASLFIDALEDGVLLEEASIHPSLMDAAIKVAKICREQSNFDTSSRIFDIILRSGPIAEEDFYQFNPAGIITNLIHRPGGPLIECLKLRKACSLYLTNFKEKPKSMSPVMRSIGERLCQETCRSGMYDLTQSIYTRLEYCGGGAPSIAAQYLIRATYGRREYKKILRHFLKSYVQTNPHQVEFFQVISMVLDSMLFLRNNNKAEEVLAAAATMARNGGLRMSTTWLLRVLGQIWRSNRDIIRTQAVFARLKTLLPLTSHPHAFYAAIIQYCVESREVDLAHSYYTELADLYGLALGDMRIRGHFALAKAFQGDWTGVKEDFLEMKRVCASNDELCSVVFAPILKEFTTNHSVNEIEEFVRFFLVEIQLKTTSRLMNIMVNVYSKAHEVDAISRWIRYAAADGCAVDSSTLNVILKNCVHTFRFPFNEVFELFKKIRDLGPELVDNITFSILRSCALSQSKTKTLKIERLEMLQGISTTKQYGDAGEVYKAMSMAFAKNNYVATLHVYKRAQRDRVDLGVGHLQLAVRASLHLHGQNVDATARLVQEARRRGCDVLPAVSTVLMHHMQALYQSGSPNTEENITELAPTMVSAFEKIGYTIPQAILTKTASILQRKGQHQLCVDFWDSMSRRLCISTSSFDLATLTTLLQAYLGLRDLAGVRWVIKMLANNNLVPDKRFRLALRVVRKDITRLIDSRFCSDSVHKFLEFVEETLQIVKEMRANSRADNEEVKVKVIKIFETAIEDQALRECAGTAAKPEELGGLQLVTIRQQSTILALNGTRAVMSIVADQVRRVDSELDRVQLIPCATNDELFAQQKHKVSSSPRISELQSIVKALSTTSSSSPLLSSWRISQLLERAALSDVVAADDGQDPATGKYETELEWLLVSKATVQTYGLLLSTLLEQTIPLNDDIWYWDEVLGSYTYSSLYTAQTSPLRLWYWARDIYHDTKARLAKIKSSPSEEDESALRARVIGTSLSERWKQFYGLVRESIAESSVANIQQQVMSPIALCRSQARHNQARLKRLREMGASGLGMLMDEGLNFDVGDDSTDVAKTEDASDMQEWKFVVERSVALMDTVLRNVNTLDSEISEFEDNVFATVDEDPEITTRETPPTEVARPSKLGVRLQHILEVHVPQHLESSQKLVTRYGRPSRLIRYWLPATALLLSSTTILRIFMNRKAEIVSWIRDLGATSRDFWLNWVVEPTKKVIGTIRHKKDSEVAIMSKESLKGDRDSLERMVVDFAIENPQTSMGETSLSEAQISEIRAKVKEGDLTPVLRAYESDLRKPFMGTIRGDLVRTLLIQVQKTKVDVEVALSGIDALLKSQELVFGFVGLTPGVLVCFAAFRYLGGMVGNKRGLRRGQTAGQTIRILRNIDRILTMATPTHNNLLSYKDHGLLLCEVHLLRKRAHSLLPREVEGDFLIDLNDLTNIQLGLGAQIRVLDRLKWGYSQWLK